MHNQILNLIGIVMRHSEEIAGLSARANLPISLNEFGVQPQKISYQCTRPANSKSSRHRPDPQYRRRRPGRHQNQDYHESVATVMIGKQNLGQSATVSHTFLLDEKLHVL